MITREDIRELAQFYGDPKDCAISFYFQPSKPTNKLHRELTKWSLQGGGRLSVN